MKAFLKDLDLPHWWGTAAEEQLLHSHADSNNPPQVVPVWWHLRVKEDLLSDDKMDENGTGLESKDKINCECQGHCQQTYCQSCIQLIKQKNEYYFCTCTNCWHERGNNTEQWFVPLAEYKHAGGAMSNSVKGWLELKKERIVTFDDYRHTPHCASSSTSGKFEAKPQCKQRWDWIYLALNSTCEKALLCVVRMAHQVLHCHLVARNSLMY